MSPEALLPQPTAEGFFQAENHKIKWYRYGSENGKPVLFLHGGPGSGFDPDYANFFDLAKVNVIALDQRGSGKSEPLGEMKNNTTQGLIADIETLRKQLGIKQWVIAGHSWGATLALLYAQAHPEAVKAITVCGLFLARRKDYEWSFDGAKQFFADMLEELRMTLGAKDTSGDAIVDRALEIIANGTKEEKYDAAHALSVYNAPFSRLIPKKYKREDMNDVLVQRVKVLLSYYKKAFDIRENQICEEAANLADIPIRIVHGRLDMDCPVSQAFAFRQVCPHVRLKVVHGSHSLSEEPLRSTYRQALDRTLSEI